MQEPETMSTETTSTAASIPLALTGQSTLQTLGLEAPNNVACQNGLVYDGKCSSLLQYAFMEQRGSYFTAWAGVMTACALVLLVCVYLPANLINNGQFFKSKYAWIVNYGVTPFITKKSRNQNKVRTNQVTLAWCMNAWAFSFRTWSTC